MLVGKENIVRKLFKNIKTIEISRSRMKQITIQQAIIVYSGRCKGISNKKDGFSMFSFQIKRHHDKVSVPGKNGKSG